MSFSYDRYERQRGRRYRAGSRRTTLGYWVPLVLTVTIATAGLAAWIWHVREEGDEDYESGSGSEENRVSREPQYAGALPEEGPNNDHRQDGRSVPEEEGFVARMSEAIRRTPSPQQVLDSASRRVAAGVAAAGNVVGSALSAIREDDKDDFGDHSRWSEEAGLRGAPEGRPNEDRIAVNTRPESHGSSTMRLQSQAQRSRRRNTVAVVVSAESNIQSLNPEDEAYQEHASILSHIPTHHDPSTTQVLILIYNPYLIHHPLSTQQQQGARLATSPTSHVNTQLAAPGGEPIIDPPRSPALPATDSHGTLFVALWHQAQSVVEKETHILPFTTRTGHIHMLRHVAPDVVYIQESLSSTSPDHEDGDAVMQISGWVGQIVVVVGDGGGGAHGGLVDTEDEGEGGFTEKRERWWQDSARVGLGKGVEIVDAAKVGEDWARRVGGRE